MGQNAGRLRIGAVRKDITPPLPAVLSGYIRRFGKATKVHDPLSAHLLLIDNGINQILLISLDILSLSSELSSRMRQAISEELNIDEKNILIAAIHTHSAPGIHTFRDESIRDKDWEEGVFQAVVKGAAEAGQRLEEASMGIGMGNSTIGRNRRKEGGPLDPNFPLICFFGKQDHPLAAIANYGCHPVALDEKNLLITADYVHYFRKSLSGRLSSDILTLFFTGASGDVDPVERGSFSAAERLGLELAEEALKVISKMEARTDIDIETRESSLKIPYGWVPDVQAAKEAYASTRQKYEESVRSGNRESLKIQKAFLLWAEELREKALKSELPKSLECRLQCLKLGEAVLLAYPFELFSSVSLSLREKSAVKHLFMVGYANGYFGYLPDGSSIREGGYEVDEAFKYVGILPFDSKAEELFLEKAVAVLENLKY